MLGVPWSDLWARTLFTDPATLLAGCAAVALVGLSKGGLGGAFALMGVPVLSLVMPPVRAAALLLPVLLMMDVVSLWSWRGYYDLPTLIATLPSAMLGIALGWLTAAATPEALVRLLVGLVALAFVVRSVRPRPAVVTATRPRRASAWFWGAMAGFTSFVAHAGGPPFQIHALPLRLDPKVFTGTSVIFFATVNAVKVLPYAALGQFDAPVLASAVVLLPLAIVAVRIGVAVVRRMRPEVFYPFMYAMVALVSLRLIYDGLRSLG